MSKFIVFRKVGVKVAAIAMIAIISLILLTGCTDVQQLSGEKHVFDSSEWDVTFNDDFNGTELDSTKWKTQDFAENDYIRRAGYYAHDAVSVNDGNLVIRTDYRESGEAGSGWYTGWVESRVGIDDSSESDDNHDSFAQEGGYFEVTAQAPPTHGIWSAFWLMPESDVTFSDNDIQGTASDGMEIDIMESPNYQNNIGISQGVLHWDGYDERHKSSASPKFEVEDMYSSMHTYGLEWTEDSYIFYIDGYKIWETNVEYEGEIHGVSEVASYMLLTVEIGGSSKDGVLNPGIDKYDEEGNPVPSWAGDPMKNDKTKFYDFIIDNVRVMVRK